MKAIQFGEKPLDDEKDQFGKPQMPNFAFTTDPTANFSGRSTPYKSLYTIFDTGTSFTMISGNYWKAFTEQIVHHF